MNAKKNSPNISRVIHDFIRKDFSPKFDQLKNRFESNPIWRRFCQLGTQLWLDTGNLDDALDLWTQEFSALTTNNTLLNREVQTGRYDLLIAEASHILDTCPSLTEKQRLLEIAFVLNASHALRLVETFDAYVSVEEHTAMAHDVDQAVYYAKRYHAICPERFIIKIPFTPAGVLAARRLCADGIPVNHTLGFSARQNYLTARIAKPAYVNVFLGRLNSFVASNNLGNGKYVGEKTVLASQAAVRNLRNQNLSPSRQIGASFRNGIQLQDLAGLDVMTIPPKVVRELLTMPLSPEDISDQTHTDYTIGLNTNVDPDEIRIDTLWDLKTEFVAAVSALEKQDLDSFTPDDLIDFFKDHHCADLLVRWTDSQIATSTAEGKIPNLSNWKDALEDKTIGLDTLMNLAGLNSFITDQNAMDDRIKQILAQPVK